MFPELNKIRGVHPGAILKRALKKRKLKANELATALEEYPQTINAITKERRGMNAKLSIALGDYFGIEKDYFMLLQACYEVQLLANSNDESQDPFDGKIRPIIFWDTEIKRIDLDKNRRYIIQRILERGNKEEITYLLKIYGISVVKAEVKKIKQSFHPSFEKNVKRFVNKRG